MAVEALMKTHPMAWYELVCMSRDQTYEISDSARKALASRGLLETNGVPHDIVREIVLATSEGEGPTLRFIPATTQEEAHDIPLQPSQRATRYNPTTLDDTKLYELTRRLTDIVFEYVEQTFKDQVETEKPYMEDRRKEAPNPFYNQTAQGFFLEFDGDIPICLWTPWGKWSFAGSCFGSYRPVMDELIRRFGATLHRDTFQAGPDAGVYGRVYALHRIDDTVLPKPIELEHTGFASYEVSKAAWQRLNKSA
jgi:hypothetical protein